MSAWSIGRGQIVFRVPYDAQLGPAVLRVVQSFATDWVPPIVVAISPEPPAVLDAYIAADQKIDDAHPATVNSTVTFIVRGLPAGLPDPASVHVSIAGVDHTAILVTDPERGPSAVSVVISSAVEATDKAPVIVAYGGTASQPYYIPVSH